MFNLLLALITGLVIGWNFHSFFMQLNPPNIFKNNINLSHMIKAPRPEIDKVAEVQVKVDPIQKEEQIVKKIPLKEVVLKKEEKVSSPKSKKADGFYALLKDDLFSDAMVFYVDATGTKLSLYNVTLLEYFENKSIKNPEEAIANMLEYQELENDDKKVDIEKLHEIEDYASKDRAIILLKLIKEKIDKKQEYSHKITLKKMDEHFTVEVKINNTPLTLLLDTGATLTMVNSNKLPNLSIIKENIILNTAGGRINAKLQNADSFSMGEIELKDFQIVSSSFEQKEADGLLGMNFFKQFKFKIDQEEGILYLSKKEEN